MTQSKYYLEGRVPLILKLLPGRDEETEESLEISLRLAVGSILIGGACLTAKLFLYASNVTCSENYSSLCNRLTPITVVAGSHAVVASLASYKLYHTMWYDV